MVARSGMLLDIVLESRFRLNRLDNFSSEFNVNIGAKFCTAIGGNLVGSRVRTLKRCIEIKSDRVEMLKCEPKSLGIAANFSRFSDQACTLSQHGLGSISG